MLIGHWPLNGNTNDYSGFNSNPSSSSIAFANGKIGQARSTGYMTVSDNKEIFNVKGAMTIAFWFKPASNTTRRVVMQTAYAGSFCINHETEGDLRLYVGNDSSYTSLDSSSLTNNLWYHCAIVKDSSNKATWYLNGNEDTSVVMSYDGGTRQDNLIIGYGYTGNQADGLLNDIRIYNHALSVYEVKELAKAKILHYNFNDPYEEPTINLVYDGSSPNWTVSNLTGSVARSVIGDRYRITSTTGGSFRMNFPESALIDNEYYSLSFNYLKISGGDTFEMTDWNDTTLINKIDTGNYQAASGIKADYTSTFRFMDFNISANSVYEIWNLQLERKNHATPYNRTFRYGVINDISSFKNNAYPTLTAPELTFSSSNGVSIENNSITKTLSTSSWDSGAISTQSFNSDCFLEYRVYYPNTSGGAEMVGFNSNHSTWSYTDIDFAIYTHYDGNVRIYENGASVASVGTWSETDNDLFRIEIIGTTVKYYKNGELLYTSLNTATFPVYFDASLHSHGQSNTIKDIRIGYLPTKTGEIVSDNKLGSYAAEFKGNGGYSVSLGNAYEKYTISFWAKRDADNKMPIGSNSYTSFNNLFYWYMDNSWKYTHGGVSGEYYYTKNASIPIGSWGHYAVTYDGIQVKVYRNGVYEGSKATTGTADFSNFSIGFGYSNASYFYDGKLDDIRVYAEALSENDIISLYQKRANLDKLGNLQINELNINGVGLSTNSIPYEVMTEDTAISGQNWYDYYGTDSYINNRIYYASATYYDAEVEIARNPVGELDLMTKISINTTHYSQYRQFTVNYYFVADITKTHRVSQWVYQGYVPGTSANQRNYFGVAGSHVCNLNTTTVNTNPYFTYPLMNDSNAANNWVLWVYYIYPYGSTGNASSGGWYKPDGTFIDTGTDYNWATGISNTYLRQYTMYQYGEIAAGNHVKRYRPRIDIIDGTEPTISELLLCAEHRPLVDSNGDYILTKNFTNKGTAYYMDMDEVSGTQNPAASQEIRKDGTLVINGEFSEVD